MLTTEEKERIMAAVGREAKAALELSRTPAKRSEQKLGDGVPWRGNKYVRRVERCP